MKRILLLIILLISIIIPSKSQQVTDSTIIITVNEARILAKMTEDLKWTKAELKVADSIITHKDSVISLKDQYIKYKDSELEKIAKVDKKKKIRTGLLSGGAGIIVGLIISIFL